ncbi:MAG: DUF4956 domain-containing protein [Eubacteriales bacterium]|jgi:hypothetical protein|nr:DUF4956 domain-containing protein [Eubacteriales bacterium]
MLDFLFTSSSAAPLYLVDFLGVIFSSLALGFIISLGYMITNRKNGWQQSFIFALIILPTIIALIILLIGNNAARALSLAGAFSLVRFRSAPGDAKDIAYVFFALAIGLACGMGYIGYAALFTLIICFIMFILGLLNYAAPRRSDMTLRITIPEDLSYNGVFDGLLYTYTERWVLKRVKTIDFGSLFELQYIISVKSGVDQKEFIDELRKLNSNLPVQLTLKEYEDNTML